MIRLFYFWESNYILFENNFNEKVFWKQLQVKKTSFIIKIK
jgi:hypothetical protein